MLNSPAGSVPSQAQGLWRRLSLTQRITLVGVLGGAAILVGVVGGLARSPEYAVAFANLRDEDAAAIVAKLKESKVPYELSERGTIRVPAGQVQEVRLLMTAQGLLRQGGAGFELFSQPHIGMTEFAEKINYQRALEGELSRTIGRLDAVETARVHLVLPQPSLFTSQQKETTASVVLELKPGRRLDAGQIQGISQLVASAVEGLKPQQVTIMDTAGAVMNDRQQASDPTRQSNGRMDARQALEARLENDVRTMLGQVLGRERAIVRVSADLDWDQYEASTETFSPQQKAPQVRSQRQVVEVQGQAGSTAGGIPGADSNVPTYPGQAQQPAQQDSRAASQSERRDTTTNYELSKMVEKIVRAPGGIKRLSVAVALDNEAIADSAQVDAISKLVATAAGLDLQRGDVVTLTSLPFAPDQAKPPEAGPARQLEMLLGVARTVGMVVGPLVVVILILATLRRGRQRPDDQLVTVTPLPGGPRALADGGTENRAAARAYGAPPGRELPSREEAEAASLQRKLTGIARSDPAVVAQLIRTWLQEDTSRA